MELPPSSLLAGHNAVFARVPPLQTSSEDAFFVCHRATEIHRSSCERERQILAFLTCSVFFLDNTEIDL
jgi:hypothetical protein